jgi:peptidoglycan/LPS O-acetylase OafA/YrhL
MMSPTALRVVSSDARLVSLDGIRGLMTLFVLASHYFAEVPHGLPALAVGWIAVKVFFALSGFLVGRLILDKMDRANFVTVFFMRRMCRTLPVYFFCVILVYASLRLFDGAKWLHNDHIFPLWSYLTFTQNFFMVANNAIGQEWLGPTWTLTVEEHFYLLAPAIFLLVPRRHLLSVLVAGALLSVVFRAVLFANPSIPSLTHYVLLPGTSDALFAGLIAAVVYRTPNIDWPRYHTILGFAPIVLLAFVFVLRATGDETTYWFQVVGFLLMGVASAVYVLGCAVGMPEAKRMESRILCFFGRTSYSVYLTHVAVLGLMHGLLLGTKPDIGTPIQVLVTFAAIPVAILVGWIVTKLVEEPITAYGRTWTWSAEKRSKTVAECTVSGPVVVR